MYDPTIMTYPNFVTACEAFYNDRTVPQDYASFPLTQCYSPCEYNKALEYASPSFDNFYFYQQDCYYYYFDFYSIYRSQNITSLLIGNQQNTLAYGLDWCLFSEGLIWDAAYFALNFQNINSTAVLACMTSFDSQFETSNWDTFWQALVAFANDDARCNETEVFWIDESDVNDCSDPDMLELYGDYETCSDAENQFTSYLNDFYTILDILETVENFIEDLMNFYPEL